VLAGYITLRPALIVSFISVVSTLFLIAYQTQKRYVGTCFVNLATLPWALHNTRDTLLRAFAVLERR
jgi:hypothetical protein